MIDWELIILSLSMFICLTIIIVVSLKRNKDRYHYINSELDLKQYLDNKDKNKDRLKKYEVTTKTDTKTNDLDQYLESVSKYKILYLLNVKNFNYYFIMRLIKDYSLCQTSLSMLNPILMMIDLDNEENLKLVDRFIDKPNTYRNVDSKINDNYIDSGFKLIIDNDYNITIIIYTVPILNYMKKTIEKDLKISYKKYEDIILSKTYSEMRDNIKNYFIDYKKYYI